MSDFEVVPANSQAPGKEPVRAPTVTVSFDTDSGIVSSLAAQDAGGRHAAMARANRVADGLAEAVQLDEHGAVIPPAEEQPDVAAEVLPDGAPVEGDLEAQPEGDVEQVDAEQPAAGAVPFEIEEMRGQLAEAHRALDELRGNTTRSNFAAYFDDPAGFVRSRVAEALGVAADDPVLGEEWRSLLSELTLDGLNVQDLPQEQQAQFRADRFDRQIKLDKHRRQAEQRAQQTSTQEARAQNLIQSVIATSQDQFKTLPLAEARHGRPAWVLTRDRLIQAIRNGEIENWQAKSSADLYTEAIRLLDSETQQWAKQLGPRIAHLVSAPAPASPGAQPAQAPKTADQSQGAAPRNGTNTAKPRTLPSQRAGAAPARPGVPQRDTKPLSTNPEERRRQILARHLK